MRTRILIIGAQSRIAEHLLPQLMPLTSELVLTARQHQEPEFVSALRHHTTTKLSYFPLNLTQTLSKDMIAKAGWPGEYDLIVFIPPIWLAHHILPHVTAGRCIFLSSYNTVCLPHEAAYDRLRAAEDQIMATLPQSIILQPTMITGRERDMGLTLLMRMAQKYGTLPVIGRKSATRHPLHFKDFANAIFHAATDDALTAGRYGVGGPDVMNQKDMIKIVLRAMGKSQSFLSLPLPVAKLLAHFYPDPRIKTFISRANMNRHVLPEHALPRFSAQLTLAQTLDQLLNPTGLDDHPNNT